MNRIAWAMLVGDRAKYVGIIVGLTFAALLITQQGAIFLGLMNRTTGSITDLGWADIWVCDPNLLFVDDIKPMQDTELFRVRSVPGVAWAVPLYKGLLKARLADGGFQTCIALGLDDATLIGGPPEMVQGTLADLRRADSIIVDEVGARTKLAVKQPGGALRPLRVGDAVEMNDHRAIVVGICRVSRTFSSQPVVYTTYRRATQFAPQERKLMSFILAGPEPGRAVADVVAAIRAQTGLGAFDKDAFRRKTRDYYMKNTGIPINFGISVALGFIVGTAIAGQTFFNFTLDNLRYFGALKAMGASNGQLLRMILVQAAIVGAIGYGIGVGLASLFGVMAGRTELAFLMPGWLPLASACAIVLICLGTALLSIRTVMKLEPAVVFRS